MGWVALVNPFHPPLENDLAPSFDPHHLRISPWLWFRMGAANRVEKENSTILWL